MELQPEIVADQEGLISTTATVPGTIAARAGGEATGPLCWSHREPKCANCATSCSCAAENLFRTVSPESGSQPTSSTPSSPEPAACCTTTWLINVRNITRTRLPSRSAMGKQKTGLQPALATVDMTPFYRFGFMAAPSSTPSRACTLHCMQYWPTRFDSHAVRILDGTARANHSPSHCLYPDLSHPTATAADLRGSGSPPRIVGKDEKSSLRVPNPAKASGVAPHERHRPPRH